MRADLHMHSTYSDGLYSPDELCKLAVRRGVELLSITDHDTMNGDEEKRAAAKKYNLKYVSGWEISAYENGSKIHITGYRCHRGEEYERFMSLRKTLALERAEDSLSKLKKLGISVRLEDVLSLQADKTAPVHTMHIARGVSEVTGLPAGEVYERYLAPNRPANSMIGRPTPLQAIECIHQSGGIASVAHPGRITMGFLEREKALEKLVDEGVDGIECYYTTHTDKETEYFVRFANERGLLITGGSDTHVEDGTHTIGTPKFEPSDKLLDLLFVKD
jgi:predicted metal-dependent phosphoesterase TrpH